MPDLLLELFSEEIPARMQARAADDLKRLVTGALVDAGLVYEGAKAFATPRRLALTVTGVPVASADTVEERKGPRVGAPEKAVEGFLKGAGLSSLDEAEIRPDPKKGDFYVATLRRAGRPATDILAEALPGVVRDFPWPKSMRWGDASAVPGALRWVRPLHSIVCTFGPETEDPDIVRFRVGDIEAGDTTHGHRFMAPEPIRVRRFEDYVAKLAGAHVVVDAERRREMIRNDAKDVALAQGLDLVEDEALLDEVAGLVEAPNVLVGRFDTAFLDVPDEVIRTTIRTNQKCFVLADPATGRLANAFVLVSNMAARDGGAAIIAGNERVIRARLSDARFFWETDKAVRLEKRAEKLDSIVFHEKLGTQGERVERLKRLAREIAPLVGADPDKAERAAALAKADLVTEMVGEFPDLQGLMGRYYAEAQSEDGEVARAIEAHYRPLGPSDDIPAEPVSIALALADKLDMLVGFWAIDEKPTGSKDPYALRRAALGVIRIALENGVRLNVAEVLLAHEQTHNKAKEFEVDTGNHSFRGRPIYGRTLDLLVFFADRLKVYLRDKGARHDLIDAVFALGDQDDLVMIVRRVEALGRFLETEDGANLLAGVKRASNILRIEEKKDGRAYDGAPNAARLAEPAEMALAEAVAEAKGAAGAAVRREDFEAAMAALARLRPSVDAFFDAVTVNAEDIALRENRLRLLNEIRAVTLEVADFSKIAG